MPQEHVDPSTPPSRPGRRYKPRELTLGGGDRLVLDAGGSITRIAQDGTATRWTPDDPEWAGNAIRFGLHAPVATANPHGREVRPDRPPRR